MPPRDWDAATYSRVSAPVRGWGGRLMDRLELRGDERLLDAGCGSGELTEQLADRLPRGRVIAVDASASMVERARERLGARADVRRADLLELRLEEPVDVVFSSATFHWISDHRRLFGVLHAALRPGGRLLAQYGGQGNVAAVQAALDRTVTHPRFAAHLGGWAGPWNFTSAEAAREALTGAGFGDVEAGMHTEVVVPEEPERYLQTMLLGAHADRLPADLRDAFLTRVAGELEAPLRLEYVRLTVSARRLVGSPERRGERP